MGCGRTALAIYGKFLLGRRSVVFDEQACRYRRTAAARLAQKNARREKLSSRLHYAAADRILDLRSAPAFGFRHGRSNHRERTGAHPSRALSRDTASGIFTLAKYIQPYFRRWLRGGLLQLEMGRSPVRGCVCRL